MCILENYGLYGMSACESKCTCRLIVFTFNVDIEVYFLFMNVVECLPIQCMCIPGVHNESALLSLTDALSLWTPGIRFKLSPKLMSLCLLEWPVDL